MLNALTSTKSILGELRSFNKDHLVVRYPQLREQPAPPQTTASGCKSACRSLSFPDDPDFQADVIVSSPKLGLSRSLTLATVPDVEDESSAEPQEEGLVLSAEASDFHVFRLDLKLGSHGSSSSPAVLVSQLEKSSTANLFDGCILKAQQHIDKLRLRVDTSSRASRHSLTRSSAGR